MNESEGCFIPSDSQTTIYAKIGAVFIAGAIGILGNCFIVIIAQKYTIRRNLTYLIISMAVSDILVALMVVISEGSSLLNHEDFFANTGFAVLDDILCRMVTYLKHTPRPVTLSTLLIISIERLKATSSTLQVPRPYTARRRMVIIGCSWGVPMVLSGYGVFATVQKKGTLNTCGVYELDTWINITNCVVVVIFLVILIFTLVSLKRLQKPQAIVAHMTEEQVRYRVKRTSRAVKMVLFSILLYTTYYPVFIYRIVFIWIFDRDRKQLAETLCLDWKSSTFALRFLPLINSCLSPVVYLTFLTEYQEGARKMLSQCFTRTRRDNDHGEISKTTKSAMHSETNMEKNVDDTAL